MIYVCENHNFEKAGEPYLKPITGLFGIKRSFFVKKCCSKRMRRHELTQKFSCTKCGQKKEEEVWKSSSEPLEIAVCPTCGEKSEILTDLSSVSY